MPREQATHQVVRVTFVPRMIRYWILDERRVSVHNGTEQDCQRAMRALQDSDRSAGHRVTYVIEPITPPKP